MKLELEKVECNWERQSIHADGEMALARVGSLANTCLKALNKGRKFLREFGKK